MDTQTMPAEIQLVSQFKPVIRFEANQSFRKWDPDDLVIPNVRTKLSYSPDQSGEPNDWWTFLEIEISWDEAKIPPFSVARLTTVGNFVTNPDLDLKDRDRQLTINSASILYSGAREFIYAITNQRPFGPIVLPSVVFPAGKLVIDENGQDCDD